MLVAASGQQVADILAALTEERSRAIAAAARARILAQHTYAHRARQVNRLLDDFTATREAAE